MNKKGFTLIELLGSIIIIAALALIAFPAILNVLNNGQKAVDDSVIKFIKSASNECVKDNINDYSGKCDTIENLRDNGYIANTFYEKYPETHGKPITITKKGNKYCYGYDIANVTNDDYNSCIS